MAKKNLALISSSILRQMLKLSESRDLSGIVELIAKEMDMAVCSCYVLRYGDLLELKATYGLNVGAVGQTVLRINEGVVGEVATTRKKLSLRDAWRHPNFSYRPETKEDKLRSFLGVPILKEEKLLGVLCVQNKDTRRFLPEEEELLGTIAVFLADILEKKEEGSSSIAMDIVEYESSHLYGLDISRGIGIGRAFIHKQFSREIILVAKNVKKEQERLNVALSSMHRQISELLEKAKEQQGDHVDILNAYFMFSKDAFWVQRISEAIKTGLTAEAAVQKVFSNIREQLSESSDSYFKERIADFSDLTNRLLMHLSGKDSLVDLESQPEEMILFAKSIGPSELFDYEYGRIKGIVLEEGSKTMHIAIIARSLGIPIVGGIQNVINKVRGNDLVIINGFQGEVFIKPADDILEKFRKHIIQLGKRHKQMSKIVELPTKTKDGKRITLNINSGLMIDMESMHEYGADGVGLYRTEIAFMLTPRVPDVDIQTVTYRSVYNKAQGKPVVFRTLDIGADKMLSYIRRQKEENPAMGWRSIRVSLDIRSFFRQQLRALIRAVDGRELIVMFPMVSSVAEFIMAKKTLELELEEEKRKGRKVPAKVKIGTMLEVPALLFQLDRLLPLVDFISIGTNDLVQFIYACDRGNVSLYERYDPLSPPILKILRMVKEACEKAEVPCSICGEMAGSPLDAMVLIGLGYTSLSMNPLNLIAVKEMILSLDSKILNDYIRMLEDSPYPSLRELFRNFAIDHGIGVDGFM